MTSPIAPLCRALAERSVRYLLIGVSGANFYIPPSWPSFVTLDYDLYLPPDANNLLRAWEACEQTGLDLWLRDEPLDRPRDVGLAEQMIARLALTRVTGPDDLTVDLALVMKGLDFETVWKERRPFIIDGAEIPQPGSGISSSRSTLPAVTRTSCFSPRIETRSSSW